MATVQSTPQRYGRLGLRFEANEGQTAPDVRYLSRGSGYVLFLTDDGLMLSLRRRDTQPEGRAVVRLRLIGSAPDPRIVTEEPVPGRSHYLIGDDPERWHTNVSHYRRVRYEEIYPGIDVVFYGTPDFFEHDFVVAPGADPATIRLNLEGTDGLEIDRTGDLVLTTAAGPIRLLKPRVFQVSGGVTHPIDGAFTIRAPDEVGFELGPYDRALPLTIDPVLEYSSYLGGSFDDDALGIAVDSSGYAYVVGRTVSVDFPSEGPLQPPLGGRDAFITKVSPDGTSLVYSTYLGGSDLSEEHAIGVAVDASGRAFITGTTSATDFPTTPNAYQSTCSIPPWGNCFAAFLTVLNAEGSSLEYSTFLYGGFNFDTMTAGFDRGLAVALDPVGHAYVAGSSASTSFPTTPGVLQPSFGGGRDGFIVKIDPTKVGAESVVYSTYLGGTGTDVPYAIAVHSSGSAYVCGNTDSLNFPLVNPVQADPKGIYPSEAFIARLDPEAATLVYSTYLGGSGSDTCTAIAVGVDGRAVATGQTQSDDFPVANALQPALQGGSLGDAFVTKLEPTGGDFVFSTYMGGEVLDYGVGVAIDEGGSIHVTGVTMSLDFPVVSGAPQTLAGGNQDPFVSKIAGDGSTLLASTFLGGFGNDSATAIGTHAGATYVAGWVTSTDFPVTPGAFQLHKAGGILDGFVAKVSHEDPGVADLAVTIDADPGQVAVYEVVTYTVTVVNHGPDVATGAALALEPAELPWVHPVPSQGLCKMGWRKLICGLGTLAVGAQATLSFDVRLHAPGTHVDTASVAANQADPDWSDNYGSQTTVAEPLVADLSITKTNGEGTVLAGDAIVYTIVVSNPGPRAVSEARVVDAFPAVIEDVSWTCSVAGEGRCLPESGNGSISILVDLSPGGSATLVASGTVSATATGVLENTASVGLPVVFTDLNPADNTATDTDAILARTDLSLTKTDERDSASPGDAISYTITVSNAGPNPVSGVTVSDTAPPDLTGVTWTCAPAGAASCTPSGSGDIADSVSLPVGSSVTYTLDGTLSATPASLSNTASATLPGGYGDPTPEDSSATDTDVLLCAPQTGVVLPDGRLTSASLGPAATQWFLLSTVTGHSYSVEVQDPTGTTTLGTATLFRGSDGCTLTSTATATDTTSIDPAAPTTSLRLSFTSSGDDPLYRLQFTNTTGSTLDYSVSLAETTLFSPAWSTNGSYNTYYSFQNTTSADLNGTLTLFDTSGTLLSSTTLAIPAGTTKATNTALLGTTRNRTGTALFTHDGPPGAFLVEADIANFTLTPAYVQPVRFRTVRERR